MQQKNFLLFIVLCILVLVSWSVIQNQIWPPPKGDAKKAGDPPKGKDAPPPQLILSDAARKQMGPCLFGRFGGADPLQPLTAVAGAVATAQYAGVKPSPHPHQEALAQIAAAFNPDAHAATALFSLWAKKVAAAKQDEPADIVLGGDDFYLKVVLTTRGGVRSLTLTRFQEASDLGLPVYQTVNGAKVPAPLPLVQDDPINPSFALYHYLDPNADSNSPQGRPAADLGRLIWTKKSDRKLPDGSQEVVLSCDNVTNYPDLEIVRTFTLGPKDYHIGLKVEIHDRRAGGDERRFKYQIAGGHGLPVEGEWYASVHLLPMLGLLNERGNFWRDLDETQYRVWHRQGGDRVPAVSGGSSVVFAGMSNQYFASVTVVDNLQEKGVNPRDVVSYARTTLESQEKRARVREVGPQGSFLIVDLPEDKMALVKYLVLPRAQAQVQALNLKELEEVCVNGYRDGRLGHVATGVRRGRAVRFWQTDMMARTVSEVRLRPGGTVAHKYLLYNGPVKVSLLSQLTGEDKAVDGTLVDRYWETLHLRTMTDYRSPGPFGAFANAIFWTDLIILFTRLMHWLLYWLHWLIPNWGLAIVLLTIIVRVIMFPISKRQAQLSIKMQEIAPEVKKLQEKYKDPQQRTRAVMELYRKNNVNPLGGCLTLLMQLPIFMGLYYCLQESVHFRLAGLLWMDNLAAPDMLLPWGTGIPLISDPDNMGQMGYLGPYFNILPIVAVALMLVQQKMLTPPATDPQQEFQQKVMKWMMLFFGLLFYKVAAGLCIYFIVSSAWGLLERRMLPKKGQAPAAGGGGGGGGGGDGPSKPSGPGPSGRAKPKPKKKGPGPEGKVQKVKNWWQDVLDKAKKK